MRFASEVEDAVDELWELALTSEAAQGGYAVARHFAALVAELCAQVVCNASGEELVPPEMVIRRTFAVRGGPVASQSS